MRVVLGGLVSRGFAELVEEGEEGGHIYAAAGATGFGEFDIVFDFVMAVDVSDAR